MKDGRTTNMCQEEKNTAGRPVTECHEDCTGRRPAGLVEEDVAGASVGAHLARMAHLEAASVTAFRRLAAELELHGAPQSLVRACLRAAGDEVRHSRAVASLARQFGTQPPAARVAPSQSRPLAELAVENLREGCIRESFGALLATWQAQHAADGRLRRLMQTIAREETEHADLAWQLDAWLRRKVGPEVRARLDEIEAEETARLETTLGMPTDEALTRPLGLPSPQVARHLARSFAQEVTRRRTARQALPQAA